MHCRMYPDIASSAGTRSQVPFPRELHGMQLRSGQGNPPGVILQPSIARVFPYVVHFLLIVSPARTAQHEDAYTLAINEWDWITLKVKLGIDDKISWVYFNTILWDDYSCNKP